MRSNSVIQNDRRHLIHPAVSLREHERRDATIVASAKGCYIADATGHTALDGFAGLWRVNAGYGQDTIVQAAARSA
jgi:adenosylmethionine-8-amino-7-oxononanoate aminotransferase